MKYEAEILLDSSAHAGAARLTTFKLVYPRFIHAEMLTHRIFSRNTSSSRAIPYSKLRQQVLDTPAMPLFWGKNKKGMVAEEAMTEEAVEASKQAWLRARDAAVENADVLSEQGLHKQHVNRLLEPFLWVTVICSGTTFDNFFRLRRAPDAQPEIRQIADLMFEAYATSRPKGLLAGEWHMPFVTKEERSNLALDVCRQVSVARCARVSYLNFEGTRDLAADQELYTRLAKSGHWSPFEHVAQVTQARWVKSGNFMGFRQLRESRELIDI